MRRLNFSLRHAITPALLTLVVSLTGCPDKVAAPPSAYTGPLSDTNAIYVHEFYGSESGSPSSVLLDINGDRIFDIGVSLRDATSIASIRDVNPQDKSASPPGELARAYRPNGATPAKAILNLATDLATAPTQTDLDSYRRGHLSADAAWRLAAKLRLCADEALRIRVIQAAELSLNNNDVRAEQSAFILAGLGNHGMEALGRVLSKIAIAPQTEEPAATTRRRAAAEHISTVLAATPASIAAARNGIRDFLSQNRSWEYIQDRLFAAMRHEIYRNANEFDAAFSESLAEIRKKRPDLQTQILRLRTHVTLRTSPHVPATATRRP
ncbi:MAG: hypothetical protein LBG65_00800 [Puniceicoccales bacterium]|jgi:hypothetical protein|nr:hypothetical protein [Puniceicoccales bacterium]